MQSQTILEGQSDHRCGFAPGRPWRARLATTVAAGAMTLALVAIPASFDATGGLPALKMAFAESGSGSDGSCGDSDSSGSGGGDSDSSGSGGGDSDSSGSGSGDRDSDSDNSGSGSHDDDDDDDRSGHDDDDDDDDRSGHGGGDDDGDSWVVREIDGQIVRTRQRDGETRIRVRNIGAAEDHLRIRLRDGETRVRVSDGVTGEDLVRVRLRDQGDEIRVRDGMTEEDLARLRDSAPGTIFEDGGIRVEITDDGAVVNVDDSRVGPDVISVTAQDDFASVQVGSDSFEAVRLPAEQTELLARDGWSIDSLDGNADGVLDADELGF